LLLGCWPRILNRGLDEGLQARLLHRGREHVDVVRLARVVELIVHFVQTFHIFAPLLLLLMRLVQVMAERSLKLTRVIIVVHLLR